jgi:hypothetical protein
VISDLSVVGQNLRDTPNLGGVIHDMNVPGRAAFKREETTFNAAVEQYLTNGSGPLASPAGDFGGWEKFPEAYTVDMTNVTRAFLASLPSDWPNVEYVINASSRNLGSGTAGNQGSIGMLVTSTTSTGNVTIQSVDNAVAAPPLHRLARFRHRSRNSSCSGQTRPFYRFAYLCFRERAVARLQRDDLCANPRSYQEEGRHGYSPWCGNVRYGNECVYWSGSRLAANSVWCDWTEGD